MFGDQQREQAVAYSIHNCSRKESLELQNYMEFPEHILYLCESFRKAESPDINKLNQNVSLTIQITEHICSI